MTNMLPPTLSVVICTRNRLQSFRRCLDALLSLTTTHPWEIVIVDNGSSDGTTEYLSSVSGRRSDGLRIMAAFEAKRGLAAARNKGWRTANGEIVAFTDDDCYVSETYVDSIVAVFQENSEVGFLGGRILLYDDTDYRLTVNESEDRLYFRPQAFVSAGAVQGANMAFRKTVLEQIGGFDERLGAGTQFPSEDIDAVAAAVWAGIPGVYDPRPLVYHHHGRKTEREAQELMRSYDAGRGAYYAKYIMKNRASRWEYSRAWIKSAKSDFIGTIRLGAVPRMRRSLRELSGGLRYVVSELLPRGQ
jgi:glycosyltransferase involved in cell wall biosynthesis